MTTEEKKIYLKEILNKTKEKVSEVQFILEDITNEELNKDVELRNFYYKAIKIYENLVNKNNDNDIGEFIPEDM